MQFSLPQPTEINSSKALKECVLSIKKIPTESILLADVADSSAAQGKDNRDLCSTNPCQHSSLRGRVARSRQRGLSAAARQKLPSRSPMSVTCKLYDLYSPASSSARSLVRHRYSVGASRHSISVTSRGPSFTSSWAETELVSHGPQHSHHKIIAVGYYQAVP